jgi:uracil-DNA glycosylase family 4
MTSPAHNCTAHDDAPEPDCVLCPRLAEFRAGNAEKFPDKHNAPVPAFGDKRARLLIVGLAPGLKGANFTGRPFTGDYAGETLYPALIDSGLAHGHYAAHAGDGLALRDTRITNAVRCVPPGNKPTTQEINTCNHFLAREIAAMPNLQRILALGRIAHDAVVITQGGRKAHYPFAHGRHHELPSGLICTDSYHCSRYNVQTGRLTQAMFEAVLQDIACKLA